MHSHHARRGLQTFDKTSNTDDKTPGVLMLETIKRVSLVSCSHTTQRNVSQLVGVCDRG